MIFNKKVAKNKSNKQNRQKQSKQPKQPKQQQKRKLPQKQRKEYKQPPDLIINPNAEYQAIIKTSKGDMIFDLYIREAPITVNNFIYLSQENFYKDNQFHRIVNDFIIQGGCPKGDGTGNIGYKFKHEYNYLDYHHGMLVMISADDNNEGGRYTNGCQFFIVHGKQVNILKKNTIFGKLIEGDDVLEIISESDVVLNNGELSKPTSRVEISNIEIIEHAYNIEDVVSADYEV